MHFLRFEVQGPRFKIQGSGYSSRYFQIYIGVNLKIWGANVSSLQYLIYIKTIFLEPTMVTWCVLALSADTQVDWVAKWFVLARGGALEDQDGG